MVPTFLLWYIINVYINIEIGLHTEYIIILFKSHDLVGAASSISYDR